MKKCAYAVSSFAAGAVLLIATLCIAQTATSGTPKAASAAGGQFSAANHPSGRKSDIAVDHAGGNGVRRMAGHKSTSTSPLYESNKSTGVNPLYESKDKTAPKPHSKNPRSSNHNSSEMTTRYHHSNKTTASTARPKTRNESGSPRI